MSAALDVAGVREAARREPLRGRLRAQIEEVARKDSAAGKPYFELKLRDGSGLLTLRAWSETPAFDACRERVAGDAVEVEGEFFQNGSFGLDARRWTLRVLDEAEAEALYAGGDTAQSDADFAGIESVVAGLDDPRLRSLCERFLAGHGARFRRAAAARMNHHARRGGLLAHTAQMLRAAEALCSVYATLNRDLLLAGTLLHDCGKLWETCPPERGFEIPREIVGEMLGHIAIGIEVVNALWRTLPLGEWESASPPSESVRLHLLHLIASHHGQLEFGSPVEPKTPEAIALHHLDNLDARIEMFAEAGVLPEVAPGIRDRSRPLGVHPARPLARFSA